MNDDLLQHATHTIEVGSKSFAAAARLFDAPTRRSVLMLYAWCRHCDDVVDGQELGFGARAGNAVTDEQRLAGLYEATHDAFAGRPVDDPAFAALQEVAAAHAIPRQFAFEHLDGFAMDVRGRHYATEDDTMEYCYHVAGVVGLMMACIMGVRDEATLDRACDLGLAFQLTNMARDIVEDAGVGRCYIPDTWLREAGVTADELTLPRHRPAVAELAARLVNLAEPYYDSALGGIPALPIRSALAIAAARSVYRDIGIKVKALGPRAWDARVYTTRLDKVRVIAGAAALAVSSRARKPSPRPSHLWRRPAPVAGRHGSGATAA